MTYTLETNDKLSLVDGKENTILALAVGLGTVKITTDKGFIKTFELQVVDNTPPPPDPEPEPNPDPPIEEQPE